MISFFTVLSMLCSIISCGFALYFVYIWYPRNKELLELNQKSAAEVNLLHGQLKQVKDEYLKKMTAEHRAEMASAQLKIQNLEQKLNLIMGNYQAERRRNLMSEHDALQYNIDQIEKAAQLLADSKNAFLP